MIGIILAILSAAVAGIIWALAISSTDPEEMERWREEDER